MEDDTGNGRFLLPHPMATFPLQNRQRCWGCLEGVPPPLTQEQATEQTVRLWAGQFCLVLRSHVSWGGGHMSSKTSPTLAPVSEG